MPARYNRGELERLNRKNPLTTSNIANTVRYDPIEDPVDQAKRGKGLYDKSPEVVQTKRTRKPSAVIALHEETVKKAQMKRAQRQQHSGTRQIRQKQSGSKDSQKNTTRARASRRVQVVSSESENDREDNHQGKRDSNELREDELKPQEQPVDEQEAEASDEEQEEYEPEEGLPDEDEDEDEEVPHTSIPANPFGEDISSEDEQSKTFSTPEKGTKVTFHQVPTTVRAATRKEARRAHVEAYNVHKVQAKRAAGAPITSLSTSKSSAVSTSGSHGRLPHATNSQAPAPVNGEPQPAHTTAIQAASAPPSTKGKPATKKRARVAKPTKPAEKDDSASEQSDDDQPTLKRCKRVSKFKLEDFDWETQRVLLRAVKEYTVLLATRNAFSDDNLDLEFQTAAWDAASEYLEVEGEVAFTEECLKYISTRASTFRGAVKTVAKSHTRTNFGFHSGSSDAVLKANKALVSNLLTDYLFTYERQDPKDKYNLFGNPLIVTVIGEIFFKDKKSLGIVFMESFQTIPLPLVALIVTVMECCIEEFGSGVYVPRSFTSSLYGSRYVEHLGALREWEERVPLRVQVFQESLLTAAREEFGVKMTPGQVSLQSRIPVDDIDEDNTRFLAELKRVEEEDAENDT